MRRPIIYRAFLPLEQEELEGGQMDQRSQRMRFWFLVLGIFYPTAQMNPPTKKSPTTGLSDY
jgi:hypothetical protein